MTQETQKSLPTTTEFKLTFSEGFSTWLQTTGASIAFSTYQAGKLFLIGNGIGGKISIFERTFARCMGLWSDGQTLWMGSLYQLWRFENMLGPTQHHEGYDRLFVPRQSYVTGDVDSHDLGVGADGVPVFVNTLFNCLARPSPTHSFAPVWRPSFVTALAPEDRCHLNGLAMERGAPRYVTAVGVSDQADGWRAHRVGGGVVMDVRSGDIVVRGLSMPHSPRIHDGQLWLLNSAAGELVQVDPGDGRITPVAFCPGYLRGLAMVGDHAIVGLSKARHNRTFSDLPLGQTLARRGEEDRCGLMVINVRTGVVEHWLRLEGVVEELYDVAILPGCHRPMALGLRNEEIHHFISIEP